MNERLSGILLHPTSLPGPHGIGSLGVSVDRFAAWLNAAGVRCWQVLPLVPPGAGDSPYSSWSAFAGSPWLLDLELLRADGLLDTVPAFEDLDPGRVDFPAMRAFKQPLLDAAADRLRATQGVEAYRAAHPWIADAALYAALKRHHEDRPWWEWPAALRDRDAKALASARRSLAVPIERTIALQHLFERQWRRVREVCARSDVRILGDLPIYVDWDSADVWAHRDLFVLDDTGHPTEVSGVPPDAFSDTGQLWGNPLYRWDLMAEGGYAWWIERMRRALSLHDRVRVDHFRAFAAYWAVPAGADDARGGRWVPGPGIALFDALRSALGDLPVVAEDLGIIDAGVHELLAATGLPGMRVLQFAFGGHARDIHLPHNHVPNSVAYTGTHDNDTTLGWWRSTSDHVRDHVRRYFGVDGHDLVWDLVRAALGSVAETAVIPMQDVLCLGSEARMNTPAVCDGNWGWRLRGDQLDGADTARLRHLNELYARR